MAYVLPPPGLFRRHRTILNLHDCAGSAQWYSNSMNDLPLGYLHILVHSFPVTYGYALQQCVRESVLGGLVAFSAIVGIIGSVSFPLLRKKLNVSR